VKYELNFTQLLIKAVFLLLKLQNATRGSKFQQHFCLNFLRKQIDKFFSKRRLVKREQFFGKISPNF
jgi:hypothetical protein